MPLVRVQVRNEYGLGQPELYGEASREDPKAVLDGVAVAGLVGILRQLGDLAEFAAEVFHGLQEQVMTTASRSHKVMLRVHKIEAALPPIEKAALAQTSHIHFAYTAGSDWHARIRNEQNHFIYNDLPRFIMDNYEECRDPPRLNLLDKFDIGGPGSCLKRYSDPTFFRRVSGSYDETNAEKIQRDKKARKSKKRRSRKRNGEVLRGRPASNQSGRMQFAYPIVKGKPSPQNGSAFDVPLNSDLGTKSESFDSRSEPGIMELVSHASSNIQHEEESVGLPFSRLKMQCFDSSTQPEDEAPVELPSSKLNIRHSDNPDSTSLGGWHTVVDEDILGTTALECQTGPSSSSFVTWDEKAEIVEPQGQLHDHGNSEDLLPSGYDLERHERRSVENANLGDVLSDGEYIKTEIVEWKLEQLDGSKSPEMLPADSNLDKMDREYVTTVNSADIPSDSEDIPKSTSGDQLAEIESETDNYMDALNTIDSESESDFDYQTKTEVKDFLPNFYADVRDGGMHVSTVHPSDHHPPDFESQTASCGSLNQGMSWDLPKSVSAEQEQPPEMIEISSDQYISQVNIYDNVGNPSFSEFESISRNPLSSSSSASSSPPCGEKILSSSPVGIFEKAGNSDNLNFESVSSDPSSSSSTGCSSLAQNGYMHITNSPVANICETAGNPNPVDFESVGKDPSCSESTVCTSEAPNGDKIVTSICESQEPVEKIPVVQSVHFWTNGGLLGLEPSKPPDFSAMNTAREGSVAKFKDASVSTNNHNVMLKDDGHRGKKDTVLENSQNIEKDPSSNCPMPSPNDPGVKTTSSIQENDENSFNVFGLTSRILANGFQRKASLVLDDKSEPADGNFTVADQTSSGTILNDKLGRGYLVDSPSSPPLEHMKISFHPIDGLDNSKLKLQFPDRNECHESVGDIFPSFQLVPEPTLLPHEIGSVSDDDTFCRSSPCMSDNYLSHQSESDSEQWGSGETRGSKDHELYNSFRISSMEFIPGSLELERMAHGSTRVDNGCEISCTANGAELSHYDQLLEFPSFDTLDPLRQQKNENVSTPKALLRSLHLMESAPLPPPPPPLPWQAMKSHSDVAEGSQDDAYNSKVLESSIPEQPGPAPARQQHITEGIPFAPKSKLQDLQELNGHKEVTQATNGKELDERTDFLQQIRTKSFNLRHTATARPTFTPGPTTNFKVTAILEKANAIRQAVGSDDGDDEDNWSDT